MFRRVTLLGVPCTILAILIHRLWNGTSSYSPPSSSINIRRGDTTAVILNWSRLSNVIKIASVLCGPQLDDTIAEIFIWNNSPERINYTTFVEASCPDERLKLYNSPRNLYFQARFLACEQANTPYCFIQDDDYLITPEVILAMRSRISQSSIHLAPPHEVLSTRLRTIAVPPNIHTSFAWLGYGTILPRKMVIEFLTLLNRLNASEETLKMADNYFTILMNTVPEVWFDHGHELGGGQPFTVGTEGEERNNRHIKRAAQMLDSRILDTRPAPIIERQTNRDQVARAPCLGKICIFETSISLLPPGTAEVSKAEKILDKGSDMFGAISDDYRHNYINHPPSLAVDGRPDTCFRSPANASEGDWISLDPVKRPINMSATMNLIIDETTEEILRSSIVEVDIGQWVPLEHELVSCKAHGKPTGDTGETFRLCEILFEYKESCDVVPRYRLRVVKSLEKRWRVCEMWISATGP